MMREDDDAFCEVFGFTTENKVLGEILVMRNVDIAISDMAEDIGISKPKAYEIMARFEKRGIVKKTRIIGKTQLYALNKEHPHSKILMRSFKDCLRMAVDGYVKKPVSNRVGSGKIGAVMAKSG